MTSRGLQVQYVLSDKTGTLTKNQMVVQRLSVGGQEFGNDADKVRVTVTVLLLIKHP